MSGRASSPVLVGRDEQMAALETAFAGVRQGGPSAVLLGGEAGVGKSRLVSEFGSKAASAGARVLTGGCLALGTDGLPFAPFTAVLRDLVHDMGADAVALMLPGRTTQGLARLLPELGEPRPGGNGDTGRVPGADGDPEADGDPGQARARLFEEVLTALEHLARHSPVVLVIEDAHWADRSSRDLLTFLISNQRAVSGLLIVVTFRSDELHRTHPLRPLLASLDRITWVERLELPRLTRHDTGELAVRILGREPPGNLAEALYHRSEGNPLFVEALLGCDGELSCELPESLRDLLLDSVRRLPEDTQEVLRVASAGGITTGHALLGAVSGLDDSALTRALRPAVTANVLRSHADGYSFRHELIREAVHEDLLPGEHGRVHSRFAEAIGADPALVPAGRAAIEVAHHWYSAHDSACALISAWDAAARAGEAFAAAERLSLLARVLELWDQVPDAAMRIGADHTQVLEEATAAAHDAGEFERGIALATSALKELDAGAEPVRVAKLLGRRGQFRMRLGRKDYGRDLEEALTYVPAEVAPGTRAEILLSLAHCPPGADRRRSYAEEALGLARQIGDEAQEANALLSLAIASTDSSQQAAAGSGPLELIAQARAMAERRGAEDVLLHAAVNESHLLEGAGDHELAAEAARRAAVTVDARRLSRTWGSLLAINQAEPLYALGRWDEAVTIAGQAMDTYLAPGPMHRATLQVIRGFITLARGDLPVAAQDALAASDALRAAAYEDQHQLPLARLEILLAAERDGPAAALAAVGQNMDRHDLSVGSPRYAWPVVTAGASVVVAAARQAGAAHDERLRDEAAAVAERLRTVAEKMGTFGPAQRAWQLTFAAAAGHSAALLAGWPAEFAAVFAAWDRAAAAWAALGELYPLAQALLEAAEAALAGGDRDGAAERLRRAEPLAAGLDARPLGERIAILARRARIRLDDEAGAGAAAGAHGLTGRELEVLRLVAAGRSNREIAAELFISPKTASVHVSNILGKLGAATRGEAAAKAHALRLVEAGNPP
ncbi:MAG: AAA family ATPase [Actinobacteria bacterium]|nr:AAA family ATPase [Actinomycetota bacterium]